MEWNITAGRPVYLQLIEQLQLAIVTGALPAGARVPPVRELAAEAGVNPNTIPTLMNTWKRNIDQLV